MSFYLSLPFFLSFVCETSNLSENAVQEVRRDGAGCSRQLRNECERLVVIVDVIDQNRALVDAPDMVRCQTNFKRLTLTDIKTDIPSVPKKKTLIEAMEAADVKKWESSSWGRKLIVQNKRASLNDFDRFKVMLAKIKKAGGVRQELAKLKKATA